MCRKQSPVTSGCSLPLPLPGHSPHPHQSASRDSPFRWSWEGWKARLPLPGPWSLRTPPCLESEEIPHLAAITASWKGPLGLRKAYGLGSYHFLHIFYWNKKKKKQGEIHNKEHKAEAKSYLCTLVLVLQWF